MTDVLTEHRGSTAIQVTGLGKRYRRGLRDTKWALRDCEFDLPAGRVAALVGANGAGKTTLLTILAGLMAPTTGNAHTERTAFVAQDKPLYRRFTPAEMLRVGARLNRLWDQQRAERWLERFEVPPHQRCGTLSGGQQVQVTFALAVGSRPDVLLLDEPLSNVDPLGRVRVVRALLSEVAETGLTVLLSTHVVAELGGLADHLLLLNRGELTLSGDLDGILDRHLRYVGPRADAPPGPGRVLGASHAERQSNFLVELPAGVDRPAVAEPWITRPVTLEELVLAHLDTGRELAA